MSPACPPAPFPSALPLAWWLLLFHLLPRAARRPLGQNSSPRLHQLEPRQLAAQRPGAWRFILPVPDTAAGLSAPLCCRLSWHQSCWPQQQPSGHVRKEQCRKRRGTAVIFRIPGVLVNGLWDNLPGTLPVPTWHPIYTQKGTWGPSLLHPMHTLLRLVQKLQPEVPRRLPREPRRIMPVTRSIT